MLEGYTLACTLVACSLGQLCKKRIYFDIFCIYISLKLSLQLHEHSVFMGTITCSNDIHVKYSLTSMIYQIVTVTLLIWNFWMSLWPQLEYFIATLSLAVYNILSCHLYAVMLLTDHKSQKIF